MMGLTMPLVLDGFSFDMVVLAFASETCSSTNTDVRTRHSQGHSFANAVKAHQSTKPLFFCLLTVKIRPEEQLLLASRDNRRNVLKTFSAD
jgi:hypothetical protein